jgi:hypothetical protein
MTWKYPKSLRDKGEVQVEEAKVAANVGNIKNWTFYEAASEEYKQGFRIKVEHGDDDISHLEFEKSKGDYFLTVAPDSAKKNEVVAIHRLSKAASQTNFIKGSGIFKRVGFYPGKPHIVILTAARVLVFNLEELATLKKFSSGDNTYSTMAVHPHEPYIMVGGDNSKVTIHLFSFSATTWT